MPRKRNPENKGLPTRWRFTRNAYYYQVPLGMEAQWDGKKTFKLGNTLPAAYKIWADRLEDPQKVNNIGQLLDRYALLVIPTKAPKTRTGNIVQAEKLRLVFGDFHLKSIKPHHIYDYYSKRTAKVSAKRELALLSHAYTKAVEWGFIERHPFKGEVRLKGEKPRTRYVTDAEILACLSLKPKTKKGGVKVIQAYIRLKLLTGLRRGDLLRLKVTDLKEDGLYVTTNKTGKPIIYEWTDSLRQSVDLVKKSRPVDVTPYLFCTRRGKGYLNEQTGEAEGWTTMWQNFMKRLLKETDLKERFTEHDLRAKVASDAENLERARSLLAHADSRITNKVYRRKPERVKPTQ